MSTNPNADAWMESYQIPWGSQPDPANVQKESLTSSVVATNRNAVEANQGVQTLLGREAVAVPAEVLAASNLLLEMHPWENQDGVPPEQLGTAGFWQFEVATNGQVYRNRDALVEIKKVVDENNLLLRAIADALKIAMDAVLKADV